jgi:hypothetical protein
MDNTNFLLLILFLLICGVLHIFSKDINKKNINKIFINNSKKSTENFIEGQYIDTYAIINNTNTILNKTSNIYLSPTEAYDNIERTNYINNFTKMDLIVRGCNNIKECKRIYKQNMIEFTDSEKAILEENIKVANEKIKILKNLYNVPWKFAKTTEKIDNSLPHTHLDTIYLSNLYFNNPSISTLIHEKIHLYQKSKPIESYNLYKLYGYERINKTHDKMRRSNPDLDEYDYIKNGKVIYSVYKDNATKLTDIKLKNSYNGSHNNYHKNNMIMDNDMNNDIDNLNPSHNEHPDEYFAYIITDKIMKGFSENDANLISYLKD